MTRKFYRTIFTIEVLSEDKPIGNESLENIDYEITHGHSSGKVEMTEEKEVDGPTMAKLLLAQASSPEFFNLDNEGNDLVEDKD